ncbi:AMP-binding protein [Pseudoxanthomonas indica]|uniref:AMP-binding enzyme n=1 Tax=Pseudoxanthomonas indica TaxID=428993 RepID=A0A1T5IN23_9GAMM|nr:AMP-binding protein [Pseudoxanthomonas indica]GGD53140.1 AMP-binding protein [Pseudoxanthomonas indica]SKC40363.1 AMP-binding enzyme [Pseudoxanthomonas indica]
MTEWLPLSEVAVRARVGRRIAPGMDHAQFRARVADWREAFARQAGRDVALYFEDAVGFAAALFGAWHAGKRVMLCGDNLASTLERAASRVDGFAGDVAQEFAPLQPEQGGDPDELVALDEAATQLFVFTSGSTGEPVAIEKRLDQLAREVEALEASFGEEMQGAVVHGTVSHQHIYGLLFRVLWPLAAGREIAPRTFFHEDLLMAVGRRPAVLVASPAHLKRLPSQLDWAALHGQLRTVFSSGGALGADAALDARRHLGVAPTEIYGSSETGGIAWRRWNREQPAWHALPGVSWRIVDARLEVRSPHLADAHEWWRSEDRVATEGEGFRLLGRADRIVKIEERRVSLDALERHIAEHPCVQEARIGMLPGARDTLVAVIVPNESGWAALREHGRRALSQTLSHFLAASHDAVARPRRWRFAVSLPVNAQGKVTDRELMALFRPERPEPHWRLREAESAELELDLSPDLAVFDGHFPQAAVLPGVAQLDWAIRFGREAFPLPPRFLRMEALKFQRVARPHDRIRLQLQWLPAKQCLQFTYTSAHGPHASGRVVLGE